MTIDHVAGPEPCGPPAARPPASGPPASGPLSVGQLASRAGVRPDTIRYYERSGLLPQPRRTDGDHRLRLPRSRARNLVRARSGRTGRR